MERVIRKEGREEDGRRIYEDRFKCGGRGVDEISG